jgi:hypothetical protein
MLHLPEDQLLMRLHGIITSKTIVDLSLGSGIYSDHLAAPPKGVSTLSWWWGLHDSMTQESYTGGSLTTSRVTHAGKVKG